MDKKKILIIDDEVSFAEMLKLNLEKTGNYEVRTEYKGIHGINTAKKFKPDLILLDIMMPDKSGLEILEMLKQDEETAPIPVVMESAVRGRMIKDRTAKLGEQDFIEKPFLLEDLKAKIEGILRKNR